MLDANAETSPTIPPPTPITKSFLLNSLSLNFLIIELVLSKDLFFSLAINLISIISYFFNIIFSID